MRVSDETSGELDRRRLRSIEPHRERAETAERQERLERARDRAVVMAVSSEEGRVGSSLQTAAPISRSE